MFIAVSASVGGCLAAVATCPLDVVKTRMQALNKRELTGTDIELRRLSQLTTSEVARSRHLPGAPKRSTRFDVSRSRTALVTQRWSYHTQISINGKAFQGCGGA